MRSGRVGTERDGAVVAEEVVYVALGAENIRLSRGRARL